MTFTLTKVANGFVVVVGDTTYVLTDLAQLGEIVKLEHAKIAPEGAGGPGPPH